MDRTVPKTGSEEIELYIRTYYSLLRSSDAIQIDALVETHTAMNSVMHMRAADSQPDAPAFTYASLRLPPCIVDVKLVVLGQNHQNFRHAGYPEIEDWERVTSPARRRHLRFNHRDTLACYITSRSDIDDLIPILTAYQIEWNKLHQLLQSAHGRESLNALDAEPKQTELQGLADSMNVPLESLARLHAVWGSAFVPTLKAIAARPKKFLLRLLSGSLINYQKGASDWWRRVREMAAPFDIEDRPVYFVSSNPHALPNLLTGFALREGQSILDFVNSGANPVLQTEYQRTFDADAGVSSDENFLYYALRSYLNAVGRPALQRRVSADSAIGIRQVTSQDGFDLSAQVIELKHLRADWLDPRLHDLIEPELLALSDAVILNIDYPLGMTAYHVLSKVSESASVINGLYVMGKAASLNGRIGDVQLPLVVYDEHSQNTYLFGNCFRASEIAPYLHAGSVLDNQKAVTVRGTFLQNPRYMDVFYSEGYSSIEMEAGPYLSAVYEMVRPQRHPKNEIVTLYNVPFDIGFIHYVSDTPLSKGKTLAAGSLSYMGIEPTYASAVAILRRIFQREAERLRRPLAVHG